MTSAARASTTSQVDWRVVVGGGAKLGVVTAIGVVAFALLSRGLAGTAETVVQSLFVLAGLFVFAYVPSMFLRPTEVDTIAWASMIGLMGALFFTVIDTAVLRPIDLYDWSWDAIGGGSGFWYLPVWYMGSAVLAWLGAWVVANGRTESAPVAGVKTVAIGVVVSAILIGTGLLPFHAAAVALGATVGLVLHLVLSAVMGRG